MSAAAEIPDTLVVERVFPHPLTKLWRALTESPLLARWMMPNDFEPVVGHKFRFHATPAPGWNGLVDCEVLAMEPPGRLSYSWRTGPPEAGMQWVVLLTLTPAEGGTRLRMEQSGFRPGQPGNYHGAKYGWHKMFTTLEHLLAGSQE